MKKSIIIVLFISLLISCKTTTEKEEASNTETSFQFQSKLDSIYKANPESVGLLVNITSTKKNLNWSGAVGYSNKIEKTKLESDQPVLIASNTKTFVAATILRLYEENQIDINASIATYLTEKTKMLLEHGNYDLSKIKVAHLLSHTSGINDYVDALEFKEKLVSNPTYHWTRDEQIELGIQKLEKVGAAGELYKYSDTNYLLSTEIIEQITGQEFYKVIRNLLDFKKYKLANTWFEPLENQPKNTKPLAHQYVAKYGIDTYDLNKSFDLYGGGGIAATTKDLSNFVYQLFNHHIFKKEETLEVLLTKIETKQPSNSDYRFGIWKSTLNGKAVYGHGGFWGTMVYYIPEIDTVISVAVLEKGYAHLRKEIAELVLDELEKNK